MVGLITDLLNSMHYAFSEIEKSPLIGKRIGRKWLIKFKVTLPVGHNEGKMASREQRYASQWM